MITQELNDRLTQVGPGTPMGNLMRRYWHPAGTLAELLKEPVQPIRLLGEDLTLFRDGLGNIGVIGDRCAHRAVSMAYGIPQDNGLRCAYHGWTYNTEGRVVDMPFEPACLPLKVKAYPAQELGGIIWTYMGPSPAPLLPRWELLVRTDLNRKIMFRPVPCNWLQCMDNSLDPIHFEHLHGHYQNYYNSRHGLPRAMRTARHLRIDFDIFEYGIYKRRLVEGDPEDCDDWTTGHPILFPNTLCQGTGDSYQYQIRVPVDDTHTLHLFYGGKPYKADEERPADPTMVPVERQTIHYDHFGIVDEPGIVPQDEAMWIGQGPVSERTLEHLATSDKGVILYHNLLLANVEKVEHGEEPMCVIRDEAKNEPFIHVKRERTGYTQFRMGQTEGVARA